MAGLAGVVETLLHAVLGVAAATLASMSGVGGGVFFVPIYLFLLDLEANIAVGTSKLVVAVVSIISGVTYLRQGSTSLRRAAPIMVAMIPGSMAGAYLVAFVNPRLLEIVLAAFIGYYSMRLLYRSLKGYISGSEARIQEDRTVARRYDNILMAGAGAVAGVFAGLTGTGGGAVIVPILTTLRIAGLKEAVATSMLSISLGAIASAVVHAYTGVIDYRAALPFAAGALVGSVLGPTLAKRMSIGALRPIVGGVLLLVALRLLLG